MCAICVEKCAAARYVRLPENMPGCPASGCPELCPAARNYARLPGMPGCPVYSVAWYARLPGNMPGNMPGCPELCPECPAPRHRHYSTLGRPTPSVSGAAGDLRRSRRATARHHAKKSRPGQGPRQRRPLHARLGCAALNIQEKHR